MIHLHLVWMKSILIFGKTYWTLKFRYVWYVLFGLHFLENFDIDCQVLEEACDQPCQPPLLLVVLYCHLCCHVQSHHCYHERLFL